MKEHKKQRQDLFLTVKTGSSVNMKHLQNETERNCSA